ncbi:hypothetical protein BCF33_1845 [Hasllibacter halocynthiae]|uniref:Uncharacterized protein n=1 Tax=Hasllibacter halocynthiae TaxID=595589 RepID=A0A2T0X222_9RHOB|nr:hypothetical protein BCF33_1845 [Hasllibacter halocynthiae]
MTAKGAFLVLLFLGVVLGTAWLRWRLSHGRWWRR